MGNSHSTGIFYVVTGDKSLGELSYSIRSLVSTMPETKVSLALPQGELASLPKEVKSTLDKVIPLELPAIPTLDHAYPSAYGSPERYLQRCQGLAYKVLALAHSPYTSTLFLDADTYVLQDVSELFKLNEHFDVSLCIDQFDRSHCDNSLSAYTPYNTGVMVMNYSERTRAFLATWYNHYLASIHQYPSDQTAFMKALLDSPINTYCLPSEYNFKINAFQTVSRIRPKILHGRAHFGWQQVVSELEKANTTTHVWQVWNSQKQRLTNQTSWQRRLKEFLRPVRKYLLPVWRFIQPKSTSITR
jgi:hypothetical protein